MGNIADSNDREIAKEAKNQVKESKGDVGQG